MTVEQLATWITDNNVDKRVHSEQVTLTGNEIAEYKDKIALATAKIYELESIKKDFETVIKNGTDTLNGEYQPQAVTIPPTKGSKALEANRKFCNDILQQGYTEVSTDLYGIPWPEGKQIIFVDIEGKEYFNEPMSDDVSKTFNAEAQLFPADSDPLEA